MIIAQVDGDGGLSVLRRCKEMVGLGRISFPSRRLTVDAMRRARLTLNRFVAEAARWGCDPVLAVATSAVRESVNGGKFIRRVRRELGLHVRVISARDEARLIHAGVSHEIRMAGDPHLIIDIGGGSAEFIVSDGKRPLLLESRKLGAARVSAQFIRSDPIEADEIRAILSHYDDQLATVIGAIRDAGVRRVVGTSGTIENLAAMAASLVGSDGVDVGPRAPALRAADLDALIDRLTESTSEDRARMPGLDEQRRDQILAGALLLRTVLRGIGREQVTICKSALREGMLLDYLARHRPELEVRRRVPDPRRRAVLDLGRRCHWDQGHGSQVARLCVRLFDQLRSAHQLGHRERELIEYGALLHDVGWLIGKKGHHRHSMYLILNGLDQHFTPDEVRTIANIARYHRKSRPRRGHRKYRTLPKRMRRAVKVGAALLRVADGLDRTNCGVVSDLVCRLRRNGRVLMVVEANGDPELELWSAGERRGLFERVFDCRLAFHRLRKR